jgi:hypothetical protein
VDAGRAGLPCPAITEGAQAMMELLFGTWTGVLSLIVLVVSIVIIGYLFYMFFVKPPQD